MTRTAVILVVCISLGGCVSLPTFHLPHQIDKPVQAPPVVQQKVCTTSITADLEDKPQLPAGAKLPAPETQDMSAGFALYLSWLKALSDWGQDGWDRVAQSQKDCGR